MVEIPTPYWIKDSNDQWTINPEVLIAQRAAYYDQRMAFERDMKQPVGVYNSDGTITRFV